MQKVYPRSWFSLLIISIIFNINVGLTPAPGSSNKTSLASVIIVRPSSRSFFCPPDRLPANSFLTCVSPRKSKLSKALPKTSFSLSATDFGENQFINIFSPGWSEAATIKFSRVVILAYSWLS